MKTSWSPLRSAVWSSGPSEAWILSGILAHTVAFIASLFTSEIVSNVGVCTDRSSLEVETAQVE